MQGNLLQFLIFCYNDLQIISQVRTFIQLSFLWLFSAVAVLAVQGISATSIVELVIPLAVCLIFLYFYINTKYCVTHSVQPYLLFFSISVTSLFGFTEVLTGSHAEASNSYLYGLSFYTASIAFYLVSNHKIRLTDAFNSSNPLLLFTGPIALFVKSRRHIYWKRRVNYYLPFFIVGLFFYQIVATPLSTLFSLVEATDVVSTLLFAVIFELFVYANFCGLSLMIYGLFGMFGYKIPLNFKQPFSSSNIVDFWKGWHLSLSAVLKALFYTPLRSKHSPTTALFGVFIASALWHGIAINFLIWGVFHATIFSTSLYFLRKKHRLMPLVLLIVGVVLGRLIFADTNIDRLIEKLMFSFEDFSAFKSILNTTNTTKASLLIGGVLILIEFVFKNNTTVKKRNYKYLRSPIAILILLVLGFVLATDIGESYAVYGQR